MTDKEMIETLMKNTKIIKSMKDLLAPLKEEGDTLTISFKDTETGEEMNKEEHNEYCKKESEEYKKWSEDYKKRSEDYKKRSEYLSEDCKERSEDYKKESEYYKKRSEYWKKESEKCRCKEVKK